MPQLELSVMTFLCVELVAAALLGLWVAVRFPRLGPTALRPAMAAVLVSLFVLRLAAVAVGLVHDLPFGPYLALFACVLPGFFAAFLAAAWLMRVLAAQFGGSGGGGHRVPAGSS